MWNQTGYSAFCLVNCVQNCVIQNTRPSNIHNPSESTEVEQVVTLDGFVRILKGSSFEPMPGYKFGIIEVEDSEKWNVIGQDADGNEQKFGFASQMLIEAFGDPEDSFVAYKAYHGDWPTAESVRGFDAIIIGGSHHCARDDDPEWIPNLAAVLKQYAENNVRVVGICFGAQILARALGGRVVPNPSGRFVLKVEELELLPSMNEKFGCCDLSERSVWGIAEAHGDQVADFPPGSELLATSETASNEIWMLGDNVLACQCHPEFTNEVALDKIWSYLKESGRLDPEEAAESYESLTKAENEGHRLRAVIRKFIRAEIAGGSTPSRTFSQLPSMKRMQDELYRAYNAAVGATDMAPIASLSKSLSSALGRRAPSSVDESLESLSRGPSTGFETNQPHDDLKNEFFTKFTNLMRLELKTTHLEYDRLDSANRLVASEFQKLTDVVGEVAELEQKAVAGQEARNKDVHMVLDEIERVVESLEKAADKLEESLHLIRPT